MTQSQLNHAVSRLTGESRFRQMHRLTPTASISAPHLPFRGSPSYVVVNVPRRLPAPKAVTTGWEWYRGTALLAVQLNYHLFFRKD